MFQLFNYDVQKIIEYSIKNYKEPLEKKSYLEKALRCFEIKKNELSDRLNKSQFKTLSLMYDFPAGLNTSSGNQDIIEWYNDCAMSIEKELNKIGLCEQPGQIQKNIKDESPTKPSKKIRWMEGIDEIIILFELLHKAKYIHPDSYKSYQSKIKNHFVNIDFDEYNDSSLRTRKLALKDEIVSKKDLRLIKEKILREMIGRLNQAVDKLLKEREE